MSLPGRNQDSATPRQRSKSPPHSAIGNLTPAVPEVTTPDQELANPSDELANLDPSKYPVALRLRDRSPGLALLKLLGQKADVSFLLAYAQRQFNLNVWNQRAFLRNAIATGHPTCSQDDRNSVRYIHRFVGGSKTHRWRPR